MSVDLAARRADAADSLRRILAVASCNTIIRRRDPGQIISYIVMPMVLMLVLKPLYVRALDSGATHAATGLLVMFSVFAISIAGNSILAERTWRTWDRLRATRARTWELLVGKTLPLFVVLVAQQSILLGYGCLVIGLPLPRSPLLVVGAVMVWSFALLAIGALLATIVRSHGELSVMSDVGALTLSSLGGALAPLAIMPEWAQIAAHVSPGFWALQLLQAGVRGDTAAALAPAVVLLAVGAVAATFAVRRLTRGWGRSRLL